MEAMRAEVSESIATSIQLEKSNQELEDDRRNLALRLDESFGRIDLLERTVVNLKRQGGGGGAEEAEYCAQLESTVRQMQDRYEALKAKYVKQGNRTRELQAKLLHLAREQRRGEPGDARRLGVPAEVADALRSAGRDAGMGEAAGAGAPADVEPAESIEQVPTDVLERIEVLQDTRRRLYTAPSSQNRRPLPPEIPVPAAVLEAQRLSDEHRTALQSAPSSQLLKCIRHMDSWHEGDAEEQVVLQRPVTAPPKRDVDPRAAPPPPPAAGGGRPPQGGVVFVPDKPRRNNYLEKGGADGRGRPARAGGGGRVFVQKVRPGGRRPASAYAPGKARAGAGAKRARRPASASHEGPKADLRVVPHAGAAGRLHRVTVPHTPQFAQLVDCDHRRGCPCHSKKPVSASRSRVDIASRSTDGKVSRPWK